MLSSKMKVWSSFCKTLCGFGGEAPEQLHFKYQHDLDQACVELDHQLFFDSNLDFATLWHTR